MPHLNPNLPAIQGPNAADDWWRHAVIYQIYPRSFADGNGDGIGDLAGVLDHLDYLAELGVDALWFSPFYPSPQWDTGYDVADYFDINPEYGTLTEFDSIIARAHELGIRIIIDVVPNHTSSDHQWFQDALAAAPGSPERDRYIFRYSGTGAPGNWGSMFGGSAWTPVEEMSGKVEDRGWWYLHIFETHQPDLNWDNPEVHEEFNRFFRFWLERGVDGFRVDVAHGLVKAEGLPDDEVGPDRFAFSDPATGLIGKAPDVGPFFDQDGVHEIYREWRSVLAEFGPDRMLVAEAWTPDPERLARYIRSDEMNQAFNFEVLKCSWDALQLRQMISQTYSAAELVGAPTTWVLSNHDVIRHTTRFGYPAHAFLDHGVGATDPQPDEAMGLSRALALTTFLMGLPGSMYVYNGEELGLPEATRLPDETRQDPTWPRSGHRVRGRDGCRVPLPWKADAKNFGFGSGAAPWLPQPEDWARFAADAQEGDPESTLSYYRQIIALRRELELAAGSLEWLEVDPDVLAVRNGTVLLAVNLGVRPMPLPGQGKVVLSSGAVDHDGDTLLVAPNCAVWVVTE